MKMDFLLTFCFRGMQSNIDLNEVKFNQNNFQYTMWHTQEVHELLAQD